MSDIFEMVSKRHELTINPGGDTDPISLAPYMETNDSRGWVINNNPKITYTPDSVEIEDPSLRINLAVDMLTYIDGQLNYKPDTILFADLKGGLRIIGPGNRNVNLTPYIVRDSISFGFNPQTIDLGERDIYIQSKHMFLITVTFRPHLLTVWGKHTEMAR